ncbi:MAG: COX15/CtaA family protein [Acidobacteriota bacterium]
MRARLTPFQRLAVATTAITYVLILVGGLVRASGAGLGCPDWPRCFGSFVPPMSAAELPPEFDASQFNPTLMWTEYLNRLLGVTVGFFILAATVSAWRHHRRDPHIFRPTLAALLLTGYQGWLGGRVVAHELAPWVVTAHMLVALVIVSLLLYATVYAFFARDGGVSHPDVPRRTASRLGAALILVTLVQVAAGTQVRGGIDDALTAGTARPEALAAVGFVDLVHRDLSLVVLGGALILLLIVWTKHAAERPLVLATNAVAALVGAQLAIGLVLAYLALPPAAQVAHLTLAALLLGAETVVVLLAWWLPD